MILAPAAMANEPDPKKAAQKCFDEVGLDPDMYRIGHTKASCILERNEFFSLRFSPSLFLVVEFFFFFFFVHFFTISSTTRSILSNRWPRVNKLDTVSLFSFRIHILDESRLAYLYVTSKNFITLFIARGNDVTVSNCCLWIASPPPPHRIRRSMSIHLREYESWASNVTPPPVFYIRPESYS